MSQLAPTFLGLFSSFNFILLWRVTEREKKIHFGPDIFSFPGEFLVWFQWLLHNGKNHRLRNIENRNSCNFAQWTQQPDATSFLDCNYLLNCFSMSTGPLHFTVN